MNALGRHILVEYYNCDNDILNDVDFIEDSMVQAARDAGATVINSTFHHFSPIGVSGVVVIQESHLAIHTWPEFGYAAVDLFTCGDVIDPWLMYDFLFKAFKAGHGSAIEALRGERRLVGPPKRDVPFYETDLHEQVQAEVVRDIWFTERDEEIALSLKYNGRRLVHENTPFQKVEMFDTVAYGKMLTLDGKVMTTEKDEYVYHEMITHLPMQVMPNAKRALVIGGGDGGAVRELLKYPNLEQVVMVEIDGVVIDACKEHLPGIAAALLGNDPRLQVLVDDGIAYVHNTPDGTFDLVIVDSTDPIGPAEGLFSAEFYGHVHRILTPNGVMITQSESPRYNTKVFQEIYECYRGIFGQDSVHCYLIAVPTYPTGTWSLSFSAKGDIHPLRDFDEAKTNAQVATFGLKYYNTDIHRGCFALPNYVRELIG